MKSEVVLLSLLVILSGCDIGSKSDIKNERMSRTYQEAMDDFRSGRMDVAIDGFKKVLREEPGNSYARFMLASILHDTNRDLVGAYCGYHEFLLLNPDSDKIKLAKERLAICEKEVARNLSVKYGYNTGAAYAKELELMRQRLDLAEKRTQAAERNVETLQGRISALNTERERLLAIVKGDAGYEQGGLNAESIKRDAKALLEEGNEDNADRIKISADVAALRLEEAAEKVTGPDLIAPRKAGDEERREAKKHAPAQPKEPALQRPKTYEVQEGDTLYGIAKRFYGSLSAWKRIRDANKGLIHMDGRVRVGDEIVLP